MQQKTQEIRSQGSVVANVNPKEIIRLQNEIREEMQEATEAWEEMDKIYQKEARKRKSKFTAEELEFQKQLVLKLREVIDNMKEMQAKGPSLGGGGADVTIDIPDGDVALTGLQAQALYEINARDKDFDNQLGDIAIILDKVHDIAKQMGEEVNKQNELLTDLGDKMDTAQEHQKNVNENLKELIETESRSLQILITYIVCISFALGFLSVFFNIHKRYD